jgi:N-acetylmuramoyl-L-alanine amidase
MTRALAALVGLLIPASASALPLVAVDPGHGGRDTGAVGVLPAGTGTGLTPRSDARGRTVIYEKDVTLDVAMRLDAWLRARGFPTVMTRTQDLAGGDVPYTGARADLSARTRLANESGAELFVSIHENSLNARSSGTETYHFYYASPAARALAILVHQEVVFRLGLPDRGVRKAGFYVLKHTVMPAVLVEGAFLSNPEEALLLARADVRQQLAEAIGTGVVRYVEGGGAPGSPAYGAPPTVKPLIIRYRVTAGAFRTRAQAVRRLKAVRRAGTEAVIRKRYTPRVRATLHYVVTGQFIFLENARQQRNALRLKGFPAMIGSAKPASAAR